MAFHEQELICPPSNRDQACLSVTCRQGRLYNYDSHINEFFEVVNCVYRADIRFTMGYLGTFTAYKG